MAANFKNLGSSINIIISYKSGNYSCSDFSYLKIVNS